MLDGNDGRKMAAYHCATAKHKKSRCASQRLELALRLDKKQEAIQAAHDELGLRI
jgi:hypothetical protein